MIKKLLQVLSGDAIFKLAGFVIIFFLAKKISIEEFGVYNYIFYLLNLSSILIIPFSNTYLRDHRFYKYKVFNFSFILISIALIIPFLIIIKLFIFTELKTLTFLTFCSYMFFSEMIKAYYNVKEKYKHFSIINGSPHLLRLTTILILVIAFKITDPQT